MLLIYDDKYYMRNPCDMSFGTFLETRHLPITSYFTLGEKLVTKMSGICL